MSEVANVASTNWGAIASATTALCTVLSAFIGGATWYLKRLIQDQFALFQRNLDDRFVSFDTHKIDIERFDKAIQDIELRLKTIMMDFRSIEKEVASIRGFTIAVKRREAEGETS